MAAPALGDNQLLLQLAAGEDTITAAVPDADDQLTEGAVETLAAPLIPQADASPRLPKYFTLTSNFNNKYLRYIDADAKASKYLQFSGPDTAMNASIRFEAEVAKSGHNLVHIKSCYNNMYWGMQGRCDGRWIVARTEKPEEDQSKSSCTLFEPIFLANDTLRLRHVNTKRYTCLWMDAPPQNDCLYAGSPSTFEDQSDVYTVRDWEKIVILPKHIVFKGANGHYLGTFSEPCLAFVYSDLAKEYKIILHEVIPGPHGSVRIKNVNSNKYWRHKSQLNTSIVADSSDEDSNNPETLFQPVKLSDNTIALFCVSSSTSMYCTGRYVAGYGTRYVDLCTGNGNIDEFGHLTVEEPVVSRVIDHVKYRLMDAKIYGEVVTTTQIRHINNQTSEPMTTTVDLTHADTRSSSWNSGISLKLGASFTMKAGVPFIGEAEVKISAEISSSYNWGEAKKSEVEIGSKFIATVPKMSKVKVTLLATRGFCDVPFSYVMHDTLYNGDVIATEVDGGVYTGLNSYNFKYETTQMPL